MIFDSVDKEVSHRLRQVEIYLRFVGGAERKPQEDGEEVKRTYELREDVRCAKGLFFVQLYGVLEFVVVRCSQSAITHLNGTGLKVRELSGNVQCLALDPKFQSIESSNGKRVWDRRWELLDPKTLSSKLAINSDLCPIPFGNIKDMQLEQLGAAFGIKQSLLPEPNAIGYVNELATNRMAIAHGRESPADVGQRYTFDALSDRLAKIRSVCEHIIFAFEDHMAKEHYRQIARRGRRSA